MICCLTYVFEFDVVAQHIRKYLQELLSLISELWSSFTLPAPARPPLGYPVRLATFPNLVEFLRILACEFYELPTCLDCFRFSTSLNSFAWLSMMNSEHIFLLFCQAVFRSLVMQNGAMTTLMFLTFSTPWKCLVVGAIFSCILL